MFVHHSKIIFSNAVFVRNFNNDIGQRFTTTVTTSYCEHPTSIVWLPLYDHPMNAILYIEYYFTRKLSIQMQYNVTNWVTFINTYPNNSFWYFLKLISNVAILPTGKLIIGFFVFGTLHVLLSPFIHTNLFVIVLAYGLLSMMSL